MESGDKSPESGVGIMTGSNPLRTIVSGLRTLKSFLYKLSNTLLRSCAYKFTIDKHRWDTI